MLHPVARYARFQDDGGLAIENGVAVAEALRDVELLLRWPEQAAYVQYNPIRVTPGLSHSPGSLGAPVCCQQLTQAI